MSEHLALAQRFFGAFGKRDLDTVRECLAEDVVWHVPGKSLISGEHRGREGILAYFARLHDLTSGTWKTEPVDMLEGRTGVVLLARASGERAGRRYQKTYCLRLAIREGRVWEARLYNEDQAAFEEFWS